MTIKRALVLLLLCCPMWVCENSRGSYEQPGCRARIVFHSKVGPFACDSFKDCPKGLECRDLPGDGQHKRFCLDYGGEHEQCRDNADCPAGRICGVSVWSIEGYGGCVRPCETKSACKERGECNGNDGKCVAVSSTECRRSGGCKGHGRCTVKDGACVVTAEDCLKSEGCKWQGRCTVLNSACKAVTDADCQPSMGCKQGGVCVAKDGGCIIGAGPGCRASESCRTNGLCEAVDGQCAVVSNADCAASYLCKRDGTCSKGKYYCKAGSDLDCLASTICRENNKCLAVEGRCVERVPRR